MTFKSIYKWLSYQRLSHFLYLYVLNLFRVYTDSFDFFMVFYVLSQGVTHA
nr:MAG TPA: hypothetical protein [Bacteriophage sp.]